MSTADDEPGNYTLTYSEDHFGIGAKIFSHP
jgi:hypothetical protein